MRENTTEAGCGLDEAIAALVDGMLDARAEGEAWRHLRACEPCRESALDWLAMRHACLRVGAYERRLPGFAAADETWCAVARALAREPGWAQASGRIVAFRARRRTPWGWAAAAAVVVVTAASAGPSAVRLASGWWAPAAPVAEIELYWHQHGAYANDAAGGGLLAPEIRAVEAGFQQP